MGRYQLCQQVGRGGKMEQFGKRPWFVPDEARKGNGFITQSFIPSFTHSFTHSTKEHLLCSWHLSICWDTLVNRAKSLSSGHLSPRGPWNAQCLPKKLAIACIAATRSHEAYTGGVTQKSWVLEQLISDRKMKARPEAGRQLWKHHKLVA